MSDWQKLVQGTLALKRAVDVFRNCSARLENKRTLKLRIDMKKRLSVLILDDDLSYATWLRHRLIQDVNVLVADTVERAKEFLRSSPLGIDVVMTDLVLSPGDRRGGLALIEEIRKHESDKIAIVAMSAYIGDFEDILSTGADAVVSKEWVTTRLREPDILVNFLAKTVRDRAVRQPSGLTSSALLDDIKRQVVEEIQKLSPIKERTIFIPNEGPFELIKPLVGFKREIETQLIRFPYEKNVFLMMKFRPENRDLTDYILEHLARNGLNGIRADDDEWDITSNVYNPIAVLYCCKFGIALFNEPEEGQAYSPNVAYELGMMHYQRKDVLILKHASLPGMPFDLIKDIYQVYERDLRIKLIIDGWLKRIRSRLGGYDSAPSDTSLE